MGKNSVMLRLPSAALASLSAFLIGLVGSAPLLVALNVFKYIVECVWMLNVFEYS